jgi:hypothetical protein
MILRTLYLAYADSQNLAPLVREIYYKKLRTSVKEYTRAFEEALTLTNMHLN